MKFPGYGLPKLSADLLLLHAPAVYDFRERRDVYFPFLGTSGDVPITPLYEYFPVGFKSLQRFLGDRGHEVKILNLSSLLIRYPHLSLTSVLEALDVGLLGIDLHWMVHVQGSLAVAREAKRVRPEIPVVFGGISATYYAGELIRYPFVDMVVRGYDTLEPMGLLMERITAGGEPSDVPNLVWKDRRGEVRFNPFTHLPDTYACGTDWSRRPERPADLKTFPILEVLSTQNAGCAYNCGWCGGSREAFRRIYGRRKAMARKPFEEIRREFETLDRLQGLGSHHFYSVGSYNETRAGIRRFLDLVSQTGLKSISYEQFHLTPDDVLREMVRANPRTMITLSPESHDPTVARLSGRGVYGNEEMEEWVERALDIGVFQIDIWYFIGMPEQTRQSVLDTVSYCERLLKKFRSRRVNPMICPMIPFLDPASTFFEHPEEHGYHVFYRSVEEHRLGMMRASLINRTNYETRYLSRSDLLLVGYEAVRRLTQAKVESGFLPEPVGRSYVEEIDDAVRFVPVVHEADSLVDDRERSRALEELADEILARNRKVIFHGVSNQAFPIHREIGGRWFDEMGWPIETLDRVARAGDREGSDLSRKRS